MAQKKKIIALDIGAHSTKVAVATVDCNDVKISRLETFRTPAGESGVIEALRPWMEKHNFTNSRAVIALSGKDVIFQPVKLVPADPRTAEQAAAMEVLKFNEMASESMIFDFSEFSLGKEDRRMLLAIARPSLLDLPLALASARSLQIEDIIPAPIAAFNALPKNVQESETATVLINAGHASTSLSISVDGQLVFARAFSCGGQLFTSAIAEKEGLPAAQAENAKHATGSLKPGTPHAEALRPAADRWYAELNSCLSIFKSLFPSDKTKLGSVIFTGGTAHLDGLPEFLSGQLACEVTVPSGNADSEAEDVAPEYTVCAGLARSLCDQPAADISLMPEYIRDDIATRRQLPFWYAGAAAALIILGVSLIGGYMDLNRTKAYLNTQRADLRVRQNLVSQIESVRMNSGQIQYMASPIEKLLNATPVMTSIIKTVAETRGATEWITLVCDSDSYFNPDMYSRSTKTTRRNRLKATAAEKKKAQSTGMSSVIIEGFTRNSSLSSVSRLIGELAELEFVESADLLSDDMLMGLPKQNIEQQLKAIRFVIEVKVQQK